MQFLSAPRLDLSTNVCGVFAVAEGVHTLYGCVKRDTLYIHRSVSDATRISYGSGSEPITQLAGRDGDSLIPGGNSHSRFPGISSFIISTGK